jgi:hypothetical protein
LPWSPPIIATKRNKNLREMVASFERGYFKPCFIALSYVALGNYDQAFAYLEKSFAERDNWLLWFATEPKLDPLRGDPRFKELFRRTNAIGYVLA